MENDGLVELSTVEAIKYVKDYFGVESNYKLAKMLCDRKLTVQPIQIAHYESGRKMMKRTAKLFLKTFGIIVNDTYKPQGRYKNDTISSPGGTS